MTFVVSHLVCCNIRRTVGSLWSSCVISRRVTHLEPSYRADKLLLCLGHLEGWSHSLHWTPYTTQSFPEWKRYVTWSWLFDKLTYTVGTVQSVTEPWKFGSDSKKIYRCCLAHLAKILQDWNKGTVWSAAQQKFSAKIKRSREKFYLII